MALSGMMSRTCCGTAISLGPYHQCIYLPLLLASCHPHTPSLDTSSTGPRLECFHHLAQKVAVLVVLSSPSVQVSMASPPIGIHDKCDTVFHSPCIFQATILCCVISSSFAQCLDDLHEPILVYDFAESLASHFLFLVTEFSL